MNKNYQWTMGIATLLALSLAPRLVSAQDNFSAMLASFEAEPMDKAWADVEAARYLTTLDTLGYHAEVECRSTACLVIVEMPLPQGQAHSPSTYFDLLDTMHGKAKPQGLFMQPNSGGPEKVDERTMRWSILVAREGHALPEGVMEASPFPEPPSGDAPVIP